MKWRNFLESVPVWLLSVVMASQIYNMARQYRSTYSLVMISRYVINYSKCGVHSEQLQGVLLSGLRKFGSMGDANNVIVHKIVDNEWRIAVQLKDPGPPAFEEETRLLKTLIPLRDKRMVPRQGAAKRIWREFAAISETKAGG